MINPSPSTRLESIRNIVIVGETGVGKSSLINLVTGAERAIAANDVRGVTTRTESFEWVSDTQIFRLWDTPGLGEGTFGTVSPKQAQEAIRSLLTELTKSDGVHLLVLCMRGLPRVTKGMKLTYDAIVRIRDKAAPDVPLAAVVTELEKRSVPPDIIPSMDEWWKDNLAGLSEFDMTFSAHACITTLRDDCYPKLPGRREMCQKLVRRLIMEGVSPRLVRNIVIAGEIGVGKSSLINLVLDSKQADVANNGTGPTTTVTSHYDWETDGNQTFRLWDTPGVGEGPSHARAQDALHALFADLSERGGVHLLILCIRGPAALTLVAKRTHDLVLRKRDKLSPATPAVAVVTALEGPSPAPPDVVRTMESWWAANAGTSTDPDLAKFVGHACITTLSDDRGPHVPGRSALCRDLVRRLIIDRSLHLRTAPPRDLHVLLFGETGVGKSSLINLLAGRPIASISPDSTPCTLAASEYQFQLDETTIRLWDTVGLEEPERAAGSAGGYVGAIEKAVQLIRRLNATGGISLFLFCIRGNRITATTQSNYRLFYEVLGKKEVPIALAVTNLEREAGEMEDWWVRNSKLLDKNGIVSAGHACITALEGHPRYAASRDTLRGLLAKFDEQGKFSMPSEAWIGRILKGLGSLVEKSFPRGKDLARILTKRCFLDADVAQRVATCIDADSA